MSASESLFSFIRWVMRDTKFHKHYTCTVQGQIGQTVDLIPDDKSIAGPGLSGVTIANGLPDVEVIVTPGAQATLYFENGDPTKPQARLWGGSATSISVGGGLMPFARVGDQITITSATSPSDAVTGTGIIVGGGPVLKG